MTCKTYKQERKKSESFEGNGSIVMPCDPMWNRFCYELTERVYGGLPITKTRCKGTLDFTKQLLGNDSEIDLRGTLKFFESRGGFCDCEVLMNVEEECIGCKHYKPIYVHEDR